VNPKAYEALSRIPDEEWLAMTPRLARYALSVSRDLRWRTRDSEELPGGETVTSIVSKAIEKIYSGERDWDPDKEPDLEKYLRSVIDSLLNHLATSLDNVIVTVPPGPESDDAADWETGSPQRDPAADWLVPPSKSPEAVLLRREEAVLEDHALELLLDECVQDSVLMKVLEAMMDGSSKAAEISRVTGIPIKDVYNAAKRLDRKLEIVRKRIADEENM
jgi:hypothetical protein